MRVELQHYEQEIHIYNKLLLTWYYNMTIMGAPESSWESIKEGRQDHL